MSFSSTKVFLLPLLLFLATSVSGTQYCHFGAPVCCSGTEAPTELSPATIDALELNLMGTDLQTNVGLGCKIMKNINDPCIEGKPIKFCCTSLPMLSPGYGLGCTVPAEREVIDNIVERPPFEPYVDPNAPPPHVPQNPWDFKDPPHDPALCPVVPWIQPPGDFWEDEDTMGDKWVRGGGLIEEGPVGEA